MKNKEQTKEQSHYFSKEVTFAAKGVGIILMLIHHLFCCFPDWYDTYHVKTIYLTKDQLMNISVLGKICVALFVFLSAYGMTVGFEQKKENEHWSIIKSRYLKLAGNFGLVYVLSVLTCFLRIDRLAVYGWNIDKKRALWNMLIDGLGLANFFGTPSYNETWWYMSVAIFMIFFIPILYRLYASFGKCIVIVCAMAPMLGIATNGYFTSYLFCATLGIFMAKEHIFEKTKTGLSGYKIFIYMLGIILSFGVIAKIRLIWDYSYWLDGVLAVLIISFMFLMIDIIHLKLRCLVFLGKHSMNIFLIHTLIFEYYFSNYIYSFKYWFFITAALVICSLIGSIIIEYVKKLIHYIFYFYKKET